MSSKRRQAALDALNREVRGWQADQELFDSTVIELAGLNRTDWRCLDILGTRGPMTAGQLAAAVRLTTGAVTGVLDRLEAAGLVRRIRDTQDRRRVIVEVTDELARQGAPVYGPLIADAAEAHAVFDVDELEVITRFIRIERELLAKHTERIAALKPGDRP
ncbi:MAG TPA: MarR family transcriptional regulator [Verrucomicrobiae bacterium]|jgi:DNA-binding MarR family transcriptional regulator|nr:MarR family transcriptional regulator [Verrucomicrobiae bacterium]